MGETTYQLVQDFFHEHYHDMARHLWLSRPMTRQECEHWEPSPKHLEAQVQQKKTHPKT